MRLHGKAKAAFLRRMAKGRNKRKNKRKSKRRNRRGKGHTMARKRKSTSRGRKRGGGRRRGGSRRRRGGGGGGYALKPGGEDMKLWAAMAGVGFLEGKSKADDSFFANKIPKPIDALGWTGNLSLAMWVASYFLKNKWLRLGARAGAGITAYQLGRKGSPFSSGKDFFVLSGYDDDDVREMLDDTLGALAADGGADTDGLTWDAAAENAMQMVG